MVGEGLSWSLFLCIGALEEKVLSFTVQAGGWMSNEPGIWGGKNYLGSIVGALSISAHFTSCSRQPDPGFWPSHDLC